MINKLHFEFQNKNKTIIKMTGATDSFNKTLNLCNSPFQSVQRSAVNASDASLYTLRIDWLLQGSERKCKYFESVNFTVSFINNPFQVRDISERTVPNPRLVCSRETIMKQNFKLLNVQTDLSSKTRVNSTDF